MLITDLTYTHGEEWVQSVCVHQAVGIWRVIVEFCLTQSPSSPLATVSWYMTVFSVPDANDISKELCYYEAQ